MCDAASEQRLEGSDTIQGPLQAGAPLSVAPSASSVNSGDELVLIDKFGHRHARRILRTWPERVLQAMGVRFIDQDQSELTREAGHEQR
jgi:hypothetical protein